MLPARLKVTPRRPRTDGAPAPSAAAHRRRGATTCGAAWLSLLTAAPAAADLPDLTGPYAQFEGHLSLLSDLVGRSLLAGTFGYAGRGGWRFGPWGVFVQVEHNLWVTSELEQDVVTGALNVGVGGELVYADGFVRTSLALGPSVLVFDTALDEAGSTGVFLDLRPVGLRWALDPQWTLGFDPLGFSLVAPVLEGIPLVQVTYRTGLYLEWRR